MKMRFQDRVSRAIYDLERAQYPALEVAAGDDLRAFDHKRPPNVGDAIEILKSLELVEARDYISPYAGGSHEAKRMVTEQIAAAITKVLIREGLVEVEIGDMDHGGYPVRGRVRVMKAGQE